MISKKLLWMCSALFAVPFMAGASTISVGTPNFFGSGLSPTFGTLINFDGLPVCTSFDLSMCPTLSSTAFVSQGVSSITDSGDPLLVLPLSQQSPPNEISTGPVDNYAGDITITFAGLADEVGIGISEDGSTQTTLTAYGATGNVLGTFVETVPDSTFNAYYVISDPGFDIKSLSINATQNLAIDDLQYVETPEPAGIGFAAAGLVLLAAWYRRRKVQ